MSELPKIKDKKMNIKKEHFTLPKKKKTMLEELNKEIEKLNLKESEKKAILRLIDIKTNYDMREVISEIKNLQKDMDSKFSAMEGKFNIILWVIGVIFTTMSLFMAVSKFI